MITSTSSPKVKLVRALQQDRRAREKEKLFVAEGIRLGEEAVEVGVAPRFVFHVARLDSRGRKLVRRFAQLRAQVEAVSDAVMKACSDTETPQGLLAVLPWPELPLPEALTFALVLDGLADPGNLGTILRTAAAAGVEAVFLSPGTVDPFNPKVVRSAMGAHFRLPLRAARWTELALALAGLHLWLADPHEGTVYRAVDWARPCGLMISSEAGGASVQARQLTTNRVRIPMPGQVESLNAAAAAAVLLFEAAHQRARA